MENYIYLCLDSKIQKKTPIFYLEDIAKITGPNRELVNQIKRLGVFSFEKDDRQVLTSMYVIQLIQQAWPDLFIIPQGAEDIVIEYSKKPDPPKVWEIMKVIFVSLISFFGTGFTIMAFHNDIGILGIFDQITEMVMVESKKIGRAHV